MVKDLPDGYLFMADGKCPYIALTGRRSTGLPARRVSRGFTPHSLRHAFVSALLSHAVPITDVATWLGHRNINVTYATTVIWCRLRSGVRRKC